LPALRSGRSLPQRHSWYSFLLQAELTPGRLEGLHKLNKNIVGNQTRDFPACRIVPHTEYPTLYRVSVWDVSTQISPQRPNSRRARKTHVISVRFVASPVTSAARQQCMTTTGTESPLRRLHFRQTECTCDFKKTFVCQLFAGSLRADGRFWLRAFERSTEFLDPSSGVLVLVLKLVASVNHPKEQCCLNNLQDIGSYVQQIALRISFSHL
jgi:hypothetical protein